MAYSRSLVMFAFVCDALAEKGDLLHGVLPLFAPLAARRAGQRFSPEQFARDLNDEYGLSVHPFIVEDWTGRLAEVGLLIPAGTGGGEYSTYFYGSLPTESAADFNEFIDGIINEFIAFANPSFDSLGLAFPDKDACAEMFLHRLRDMHFDENIARKPNDPNGTIHLETSNNGEARDGNTLKESMDVACAAFLLECRRHTPTKFERLGQIAAGVLAAEVILGLQHPPKVGQTFKGKHIYLDAPIILDLLEFGQSEDSPFAKRLLNDLKAQGATPCIFQHNVDEIVKILSTAISNMNSKRGASGKIGQRFLTDKGSIIRARKFMSRQRQELTQLGVAISDAEGLDRPYLKNFSKADETDLLGSIRPFSTSAIESREIDAASVASFIRYLLGRQIRGGILQHERVFVTKNTGLARAAAAFMKHNHFLPDGTDSPILTDRFLGGILWLAQGGAGIEIPLAKLVANCAAAVTPRRDVINKVAQVLRQSSQGNVQEFEALVDNERCGFYLMRHSLGAAQLITEANAPLIVEQVRKATIEKELAANAKKNELLIAEKDTQIAAANAESYSLTLEISGVNEELRRQIEQNQSLLAKIKQSEETRVEQRQAQVASLVRSTKWIEVAVSIGLGLTLGGSSLLLTENLDSWGWGWSAATCVLVTILSAAAFWKNCDYIFGGVVRKLRERRLGYLLKLHGLEIQIAEIKVDWLNGSVEIKSTDQP